MTLVADTSAILAILFGEAEREPFQVALARSLDAPLLYKGGDFALTDVRAAAA